MNATITPPAFGSKYVSGQNIVDVAKAIRKDIATAIKAGDLPAGLKTSVRIERYSMGQSLKVAITAWPPSLDVNSADYVRAEIETPKAYYRGPRFTAEATRIQRTIKAFVDSYNRDESDAMVDHFDVDFYGSVDFGWQALAAEHAGIEAAIRAEAPAEAPAADRVAS